MGRTKKGFTLIEVIVVAIIIGIMAMIAMPAYQVAREHTLGNEARANIRLVAAAERIYSMELGGVYPSNTTESNPAAILSNLRVDLKETNWDYSVTGAGGSYTVTADRNAGPWSNCVYQNVDGADAITATNCPP